jgi:hypothetical protein
MKANEIAVRIHNQMQAAKAKYEKFAPAMITPIMNASIEEIEIHVQNCMDASAEFGGVNVDYEKVEFGKTREEIFAIAAAKKKNYNKRAGVRALQKKYGYEVAEKIVEKHAGRHISLKK